MLETGPILKEASHTSNNVYLKSELQTQEFPYLFSCVRLTLMGPFVVWAQRHGMQPAQIPCGECGGLFKAVQGVWGAPLCSAVLLEGPLAHAAGAGLPAVVYSAPHRFALLLAVWGREKRFIDRAGGLTLVFLFPTSQTVFAWAVFTNSKFILPRYFSS